MTEPPGVRRDQRHQRDGRRRAIAVGVGAVVVAAVLGAGTMRLFSDDGGSARASQPSTAPGSSGDAPTGRGNGAAPQPGHASAPRGKNATSPSAPSASAKSGRPSPSTSASKSPGQRVELGPGHFSAYCVHLGWEWVEYRQSPTPGAYCVKRKGGKTMLLSTAQRDQGCQWRYENPKARHYWKGKSNYCYATQ